MITKAELGWTQDAYNNFQSETGDPTLSFVLEAYTLQLSNITDPTGAGDSVSTLDAIIVDDVVVRVWSDNNTIYVNTLASEDAAEQAWQQNTVADADLNELIPLSLATDGTNVRVFYYTGSSAIEYRESADKGETWGAAVAVATVTNVKFIAATTLTRVHYAAVTSSNNVRLGAATYSASWSTDNSYIWWPFMPSSFDAVQASQYDDAAAVTNDIIVFTTDFPPLVTYRVDGTEPVKKLERVQGIALVRYQNGRWSHHHQVDTLDNVPPVATLASSGVKLARDNVRISKIGNYMFMTYYRRDGSTDYSHEALAVTRSRSGLHWEMPYLLSTDTVGKCSVLVSRGKHAYLVSGLNSKARSNVTNYVGTTNISYDLSDYVLSVDMREGDAKELKVTISNPAGVLDDQLDLETQWQMRLSMGYNISGTATNVPVILADLEDISRTRTLPGDHRVLAGRNSLGRVASLRADLVQEWESWQAGGDNFQNTDDTKYSGLRHTAPYAGHWEASDNTLQLLSSEQTGIAANTHTSHVWNGAAQMSIEVAATTSDDFAGIIFRMLDKYNFWYTIYDADNDSLALNYRRENVDVHTPALYGKTSMGWSPNVKYWLKVNAYYNYANVYTSTDGVSWVAAFGGELPGVSEGTNFEYSLIDTMRGAMGYIGHGYSEYTPSYPPPPWRPPPIDLPEPDPSPDGKYVVVGTSQGMYFTDDIDEASPTWARIGALSESVIDFSFDPDNPTRLLCLTTPSGGGYGATTIGNIYRCNNYTSASASWSLVNDGAQNYADVVAAYGGCSGATKLRVATGDKVQVVVTTSNRWCSIYGSTSSVASVGTIVPGGHDRSGVYGVAVAGSSFYACGTSDFSIWVDSVYWSSSDGSSWTQLGSIGSGTSYGNYCKGVKGTNDGDVLIFNWTGQDFIRFGGGSVASATVIENGWSNGYWAGTGYTSGNDDQLAGAEAGSTDTFFAVADKPPVGYGWTNLYKNDGWNTAFNTVSIDSLCHSIDTFRGEVGTASDRIILCSSQATPTANTRLVWLLTDAGATVSNKSSNLVTLGVLFANKIEFDQNQ